MHTHIEFQWDEKKNRSNIKKHGISFLDAQSCFYDDAALLISDPDHSDEEDRFVLLGMSSLARIIVVCHCYRSMGATKEVIRIISARTPTRFEVAHYFSRGKHER